MCMMGGLAQLLLFFTRLQKKFLKFSYENMNSSLCHYFTRLKIFHNTSSHFQGHHGNLQKEKKRK